MNDTNLSLFSFPIYENVMWGFAQRRYDSSKLINNLTLTLKQYKVSILICGVHVVSGSVRQRIQYFFQFKQTFFHMDILAIEVDLSLKILKI